MIRSNIDPWEGCLLQVTQCFEVGFDSRSYFVILEAELNHVLSIFPRLPCPISGGIIYLEKHLATLCCQFDTTKGTLQMNTKFSTMLQTKGTELGMAFCGTMCPSNFS